MKRLIGVTLLCAMTVSLISGCAPVTVDTTQTTLETESVVVRPQDDYYRYINGDTLDNAVFKPGESYAANASDTSLVDSQIETVVNDVIAGSGYEKGSEEYVIQTAYNAFLNYDFNNEPIPEDLAALIDEVNKAKTADELVSLDAKALRDYGVSSYFGFGVIKNFFAEDGNMITFGQLTSVASGSFDNMRESNSALNVLVDDIKTCMMTLGYDADTAEEYGRQLAYLTLDLYNATDLEQMDALDNYEYGVPYSSDEIEALYTNIDFMSYFKEVGFDTNYCKDFCVYDRGQAECLNSMFTDENVNALKAWKIFSIYSQYMRFIAPHYPELEEYVSDSYDTLEEQAINEVISMYSAETDVLYVERFYTKETDDALRSMCEDIREGYRIAITNATWLTGSTRTRLLEKLDNIVFLTGMDLKRHDNSKFADLSGDYFEVYTRYNRVLMKDSIDSLSEPVDRSSVGFRMQQVNACYQCVYNNVTICTAITNAPFFDADADYYTNLGGLGSVIGHEVGHAFDSEGIYFDKYGKYDRSSLPAEDLQVLEERDQKAVAYFEDNFTVFGVYHVDGKLTLAENYADLGGLEVITLLAKTNEDLEKIFENYAACWCLKCTDQAIMMQLAYDCHSPEVIRVNAIVATIDSFYDVYDVKEGDGLYIAPEDRISRWF